MSKIVSDPNRMVTDPILLSYLAKQDIDKDYVEFFQDYAPRSLGKEHSPYAKFYRDLKSNKRFMVVSGLPMVKPDGTKIEVGWSEKKGIYTSKPNLFSAVVTDKQLLVTCLHDQPDGRRKGDWLQWQPQLFLDGVEQTCGKVTLLAVDPINSNYQQNTLEWDYCICKRQIRIIEGRIREKWLFTSNPQGEVRIKHNHSGTMRLMLGEYATDEDTELIPAFIFGEAEYPMRVGASPETFYPDTDAAGVDGYAAKNDAACPDWATIKAANGSGTDITESTLRTFMLNTYLCSSNWRMYLITILVIPTAGLPDNCVITAATLSVYGTSKEDTHSNAPEVNIYSAVTAGSTTLANSDYENRGSTPYCDTLITYANWKIANPFWNDFIFNAAGLAAISKTDVTKLCFREVKYDIGAATPNQAGASKTSTMYCYASEQGNGYKPKLVVTYTVPEEDRKTCAFHRARQKGSNRIAFYPNLKLGS